MAQQKKYFKSKKDAQAAADERNRYECNRYHVYKCTKGMRHVGMYAVCDDLEWLNTY